MISELEIDFDCATSWLFASSNRGWFWAFRDGLARICRGLACCRCKRLKDCVDVVVLLELLDCVGVISGTECSLSSSIWFVTKWSFSIEHTKALWCQWTSIFRLHWSSRCLHSNIYFFWWPIWRLWLFSRRSHSLSSPRKCLPSAAFLRNWNFILLFVLVLSLKRVDWLRICLQLGESLPLIGPFWIPQCLVVLDFSALIRWHITPHKVFFDLTCATFSNHGFVALQNGLCLAFLSWGVHSAGIMAKLIGRLVRLIFDFDVFTSDDKLGWKVLIWIEVIEATF